MNCVKLDLFELLIAVVEVHGVVSDLLELLDVIHSHPEDEDVLIPHLLGHLQAFETLLQLPNTSRIQD